MTFLIILLLIIVPLLAAQFYLLWQQMNANANGKKRRKPAIPPKPWKPRPPARH